MAHAIVSLKDSWEAHGQDYSWGREEDEGAAHVEHLLDWVGDNSLAFWRHIAKTVGVDFEISEIEEVLIEVNGDLEKAEETLQAQAGEEDWANAWGEALTDGERNPSLARA